MQRPSHPRQMTLIPLLVLTLNCGSGSQEDPPEPPGFIDEYSKDAIRDSEDEKLVAPPVKDAEATPVTHEDPAPTPSQPQTQPEVSTFEATFAAATLRSKTVSYSLAEPFVEQTVQMARTRVRETQTFVQVTRPKHTDSFIQGSSATDVEETFQQGATSGLVDIVLVVDNSGSMAEEQANLSTKFAALTGAFGESDWRIGVVTTDPADGCLRALLTSNDVDPSTAFVNATQPGTAGTANEMGFRMAVEAMRQTCVTQPWIRSSSSMAVIFVSNEDNCNIDGAGCANEPWATETYLIDELLDSGRSLGVDAQVHGIIWRPDDDSSVCSTADFQAPSYARAISQTGGVSGSICDTDYTQTLSSISSSISEMLEAKSRFELRHRPDTGTLKVFVDGVKKIDGYTIDSKILEFNPPLAEGTSVKVEYAHGQTDTFQQVVLSRPAVEETIVVQIDGAELTSDYSYTAATQVLQFDLALPEASEIRVQYTEDSPLDSSFILGPGIDGTTITATVDGSPSSAFSFDRAMMRANFDPPPDDGSEIRLSFVRNGSPILEYLVDVPVGVLAEDVDILAADTNLPVIADFSQSTLTVDSAEFVDGRILTLRYFDPERRPDGFTLPDLPIAPSISINGGRSICEGNGKVAINRSDILLEDCIIDRNLSAISVRYDHVVEFHTSFGVNTPGEVLSSSRQSWSVYINDQPTSDFSRDGNTITIPEPLAYDVEVRVVVEYITET